MEVAYGNMDCSIPLLLQWERALRRRYAGIRRLQVPFHFTGKLDYLTLAIDRPKLSQERVKKPMAAGRYNRASE